MESRKGGLEEQFEEETTTYFWSSEVRGEPHEGLIHTVLDANAKCGTKVSKLDPSSVVENEDVLAYGDQGTHTHTHTSLEWVCIQNTLSKRKGERK